MEGRARSWRLALVLSTGAGAALALALVPPLPQDPAYHDFADRRALLGVPNFGDVASNLPFLAVGLLGVAWTLAPRTRAPCDTFLTRGERWIFRIFFLGVALTGVGSTYYHLAPDSYRLAWDRLPMTIAFMALFASVVAERASVAAGVRSLAPLLLLGLASVAYWQYGESRGAGDLRLYAFVQVWPLVAILLLVGLFPPRYTRGSDLVIAFALYVLAKGLELADRDILALGGVVSGHTLKHIAASAATAMVLVMAVRRRPRP